MKKIVPLFLFLLSSFTLQKIHAQVDNFNIDTYREFLQSHQNLTSEQLLDLYPSGRFAENLNFNYESDSYLDSINIKYNLTDYEKRLIGKHGFMVSERLLQYSFGDAFLDIYHKDLHVFVSTDAILHALHMSYDNILKDVELGILIDRVSNKGGTT